MADEVSFESLAAKMSPEIYASLKRAVELRKWPDGRPLSPRQVQICLEAIIHYEMTDNMPEEQRTGYIDRSRHHHEEPSSSPDEIKWVKE